MKKTITIISILVLSLSNIFASYYEKRDIAKQVQPLIHVYVLGLLFDSCPDMITEVVKEKDIAIDINKARQSCLAIYKKTSSLPVHEDSDLLIGRIVFHLFQIQCLKEFNIFLLNIDDSYLNNLIFLAKQLDYKTVDKEFLECLLKSYSPKLIKEAEALLYDLENPPADNHFDIL